MRIDEHLERAAAFERSLVRLDPFADSELYVVFLMRAATNRVNAALHALGVTEEGPVAPGVRVADLNHSYKPPLTAELPAVVAPLLEALKTIEELRPQYVRGPDLLTADQAEACRRAHEDIVAGTARLMARAKESA